MWYHLKHFFLEGWTFEVLFLTHTSTFFEKHNTADYLPYENTIDKKILCLLQDLASKGVFALLYFTLNYVNSDYNLIF